MIPPHFYIFVIISPLKRTRPFIWTNLNCLNPRIIYTKFDWIWPAGSGEEDFCLCICTLLLLSAFGEGWSPSFETPSPKNDLCQVWLKLAQWFWRRRRKCKNLQTDARTDRKPAIRIAHLSFQLRWAKIQFIYSVYFLKTSVQKHVLAIVKLKYKPLPHAHFIYMYLNKLSVNQRFHLQTTCMKELYISWLYMYPLCNIVSKMTKFNNL
jgi:hypothetical protein